MSGDQLQKIRGTTYGGTSKNLNEAFDLFAKINGGKLSSCVQGDYQKDFLTDLKMKDTVRQDMKSKMTMAHFRRDNAAQVLRSMDTRRKMLDIREA